MHFQCDRDRIVERIEGDIDGLERRYPEWHKMMELMDGENGKDLILYFYEKGFYSMINLIANNDALITSCYYPQLKMWANSMPSGTIKVFHYDQMTANISDIVYRVRAWIDPQNRYFARIPIDRQQLLRRHRTLKYNDEHKNTVEMPSALRHKVTAFLRPCIQRTQQFLDANPSLLLIPANWAA